MAGKGRLGGERLGREGLAGKGFGEGRLGVLIAARGKRGGVVRDIAPVRSAFDPLLLLSVRVGWSSRVPAAGSDHSTVGHAMWVMVGGVKE